MSLTPLFEGDTQKKRLGTIKENIECTRCALYGTMATATHDKLELMEYAVRIKDEKDREAFVSLISKWFYRSKLQIDAYEALGFIMAQLESMKEKAESSLS
jgi:hypothetical protein